MARVLYLTADDWGLGGDQDYTCDPIARERETTGSAAANEFTRRTEQPITEEEGHQDVQRSFEQFPHDCEADAAGSGKVIQRVQYCLR